MCIYVSKWSILEEHLGFFHILSILNNHDNTQHINLYKLNLANTRNWDWEADAPTGSHRFPLL